MTRVKVLLAVVLVTSGCSGGSETATPTTTAAPTTTLPPQTVKEYLQEIGLNAPKMDPEHYYLFSESVPDDFIQQHAEFFGHVVSLIGGYDRWEENRVQRLISSVSQYAYRLNFHKKKSYH